MGYAVFQSPDLSIDAITLDDIKAYYATLTPKNAHIDIAGDITLPAVKKALAVLAKWDGAEVAVPEVTVGQNAAPGESVGLADQTVAAIGRGGDLIALPPQGCHGLGYRRPADAEAPPQRLAGAFPLLPQDPQQLFFLHVDRLRLYLGTERRECQSLFPA